MRFPPVRICAKRAAELYTECSSDLAEARRQQHRGWIDTLEGRMVYLKRVKDYYERRVESPTITLMEPVV